jgi:hypothetical protein
MLAEAEPSGVVLVGRPWNCSYFLRNTPLSQGDFGRPEFSRQSISVRQEARTSYQQLILLAMSTEPLLPSYSSVTSRQCRQNREQAAGAGRDIFISATPIIRSLSFLIFTGTAIISTIWAYQSNTTSDLVSFQPSPAFSHLTPFPRVRQRRRPSYRTSLRYPSSSHSAAGLATLYLSLMTRLVAREFSGRSLFGRPLLES